MPKKPKPPAQSNRGSVRQWIAQTHWAIKFALPVLLFIGAMGSAAATWDKFGWWKPASIQYVDEKTNPIRDLQIENAEGKRDATEENIFKWTDRMKEATDPDRIREYRDRIRELEIVKRKQDDQIKTLNRLRGQ